MPPAHTLQYKVNMNAPKRTIAAAELLLIFPAALFMADAALREATRQGVAAIRAHFATLLTAAATVAAGAILAVVAVHVLTD